MFSCSSSSFLFLNSFLNLLFSFSKSCIFLIFRFLFLSLFFFGLTGFPVPYFFNSIISSSFFFIVFLMVCIRVLILLIFLNDGVRWFLIYMKYTQLVINTYFFYNYRICGMSLCNEYFWISPSKQYFRKSSMNSLSKSS